jgi:superfamily I DNA and/or RNA helicase
MFGLLVGTLNKAKTEDKQRSATDAVRSSLTSVSLGRLYRSSYTPINVQARKRQMIEQRLQDKLKKETDSVRRAEEAKKEKQIANRKEEELQLKDSIVCTSLHLGSGCTDG